MTKLPEITQESVREILSEVYDPELHIDIISMGLVYDIKITDDNDIVITMTLTTPACPYGPMLVEDVEESLKKISGVRNVTIDITFEPLWSPDKMDEDIKAALNL